MSDTVLRQWTMLRHIPRHPRKVDGATLARVLGEAGFAVSRRSIERDLIKLSALFPLCCDDQHKPYGWSWQPDASAFDLPAMDVHTALAFSLASDHLHGLLPQVTRNHLTPHFQRAKAVLDGLNENVLSDWPNKVRVVPMGQPMLPPDIAQDVLETVQAGLLAEKKLRVVYRKRGETEARTHDVHPHALVWRDSVGYLLCTLRDYDDLAQLVLHRMVSVEALDEPRRPRPDFSLDNELARGMFHFLLSEAPIRLEMTLHAFAAVRVRETPLAVDQELVERADGQVTLRATVADTVQLRTWILSLGEYAEVVGPAELRAAVVESLRGMNARYGR